MVPPVHRSADQMETSQAIGDHGATDLGMNGGESINPIRGRPSHMRVRGASIDSRRIGGRSITRNDKLERLRRRGIPIDIHFPKEFGKVCGRHACIFKSEITVCVRQHAPLRVKKWKDIDENFQKRSRQNSVNRSKQELKSLVGTKSIVQIAYELKNPETGEWPSAMEVWKATYLKFDGTWSVPNGDEILNNLEAVAETERQRISSAAVPLAEHFALVLGRKANHSRGVGISAVNQGAEERHRVRAQAQAAEQRADDAQQHSAALQEEVRRLTEANVQLEGELQSQREELNSQRRTVEAQSADMERLMDQKLEERMNMVLARMTSSGGPCSVAKFN